MNLTKYTSFTNLVNKLDSRAGKVFSDYYERTDPKVDEIQFFINVNYQKNGKKIEITIIPIESYVMDYRAVTYDTVEQQS